MYYNLSNFVSVRQVLRQIQYTNRKPAYYLNRVFKLTCSELNGRFMSNEYVQTVCILVLTLLYLTLTLLKWGICVCNTVCEKSLLYHVILMAHIFKFFGQMDDRMQGCMYVYIYRQLNTYWCIPFCCMYEYVLL
jgi:hypothetical protein